MNPGTDLSLKHREFVLCFKQELRYYIYLFAGHFEFYSQVIRIKAFLFPKDY